MSARHHVPPISDARPFSDASNKLHYLGVNKGWARRLYDIICRGK